MDSKETGNAKQNSAFKRPTIPVMPQRGDQVSPELQQQINRLNLRINNVNLAHSDLLREMDIVFKTMATTIGALQKENTELKAKIKEPSKIQ